MSRLIEQLLHAWNPPRGFYRLTPRGRFFRTLWAGPVVMGVVFVAFYVPTHHVGLPIYWPLMTVVVLVPSWVWQLLATRALWKKSEVARQCSGSEPRV